MPVEEVKAERPVLSSCVSASGVVPGCGRPDSLSSGGGGVRVPVAIAGPVETFRPHAGQFLPGTTALLPQWGHNIALWGDYAPEPHTEQQDTGSSFPSVPVPDVTFPA